MSRISKHRRRMLAVGFLVPLAALGSGEMKPDTVILGEGDNGRKIRLRPGAILEIRLGAQLGTGFSWQPPRTSILALAKSSVEPGGRSLPGGQEQQVFQFSTPRTGKEVLQLEYRRPWEKDASPTRRFSVEVTVAAE